MARPPSSSQSRPARGKTGNSSRVAYVIAIGLFFLVAVILGALWWAREGLPGGPDVAYTQFGPIRVSNKGYAMLTTLSLQTSASDAQWAKENSVPLLQALRQTLADTDMPALHNPDAIQHLQHRLEQATNAAFPGSHVQQVFVTDLVFQFEDE